MIALLGAICTMLVFLGGGISTFDRGIGFLLTVVGTTGLGMLFAYIQSEQWNIERFDTREGLTVEQLRTYLASTPAAYPDTKVFVGDQGLHVAGSVFICVLDGRRTVVIERLMKPADHHHDIADY